MAYADNKPRTITEIGVRVPVELVEPVRAGDLLMYAGGWCPADPVWAPAQLVALEDGETYDVINAAVIAVVTSVTGGTPNSTLYLSATPGESTETDPGTPNTQIVGVVLSATQALLAPSLYTAAPALA